MPTPLPAGLRLGAVEPRDAVEAFQRRKLLAPSYSWLDTWQEEHARSFAVAGVQRLDILALFQAAIDDAISNGTNIADYRQGMRDELVQRGWWGDIEVTDPKTGEQRITRFNDQRLALIFDVNLRQSQAAGRWARIQRTKERFPFILYRTMNDERVRASHRPWNGLALPVDHPFWDTHFPPNGWHCRCTAFAVDERDLQRRAARGETILRPPPPEQLLPYVNPRTGETAVIPRGIDPGFAYNPGKARDQVAYDALLRKAVASHPLAAAVAVAQAQVDRPAFIAEKTAEFGNWAAGLYTSRQATGEVRFIGALPPPVVRALADADALPLTAAIAVRDVDVLHATRLKKVTDGVAVPLSVYLRLPELLERASAVLLEGGEKPALLYVVDTASDDGTVAKVVVRLDMPVELRVDGKKAKVPLNLVRTATYLDPQALRDRKRYRLVWGKLE